MHCTIYGSQRALHLILFCKEVTPVNVSVSIFHSGKILVHCVAGYRRSPTIAIAYMMIKHKKHLWDVVVEARSNRKIFPNDGFIEQLCMLEKELYG